MAYMGFREPNQVKWVGSRPAHNGEQVFTQIYAESETAIVYTVPAGKVLYLISVELGYRGIAAGRSIIRVRDATDVTVVDMLYDYLQDGSKGDAKTRYFYPPLEIPAAYDIVIISTVAGLLIQGSIFGWVE